MNKSVVLNGYWGKFTLYLEKHLNVIFAFELGLSAGILLALLMLRLIAGA